MFLQTKFELIVCLIGQIICFSFTLQQEKIQNYYFVNETYNININAKYQFF